MIKKTFIACVLMISFVSPFYVQAQQTESSSIHVKKTSDFDITGSGDNENWEKADWITLKQRTNHDGSEEMDSKFKILYSDSGIYLLYSSKDEILNASVEEDFAELWHEDVVEAFFWPDQQEKTYFEYELSPLNYELPILVSQKSGDTVHWIPFEYSYKEGRKTHHKTMILGGEKEFQAEISGWLGEIFIPFRLLIPLDAVPPASGSQWKANFYRVDIDHGDTYWSWQPFDETFHDLKQYGTIIFE